LKKWSKIKDIDEMKDQIYEDWKLKFDKLKATVKRAYRRAGSRIICEHWKQGKTGKPFRKRDIEKIEKLISDDLLVISIDYAKDWNDFWNKVFVKKFKGCLENVINMKTASLQKMEFLQKDMELFDKTIKIVDLNIKTDIKNNPPPKKRKKWKNPESESELEPKEKELEKLSLKSSTSNVQEELPEE